MTLKTLSKEDKVTLVNKLQAYFEQELDQELGDFDAEFLLDFFAKELGNYYYNQGLHDAQALINNKVELLMESVYELELPVN